MMVVLALLLGVGGAGNAVVPGDVVVDPPTVENLGFRWYIEGDSNRNASVAVSYRRQGEEAWKPALPMLRVHHEVVNQDYEPYRAGNLFAGSVLLLEPGTTYEVRLSMTDPDGGAPPPRVLTVATRSEPEAPSGGRQLHVYPADYEGARPAGSFASIAAAYKEAVPGDIIALHAGTYRFSETFVLDRSGEPDKPIVFRGDIDGAAVIEGAGYEMDLFDIRRADHVMFEGVRFRKARTALLAGTKNGHGASGLTVRRCRIEDVIFGINSTSERSEGWYIADNELTGINPTWYPRPNKGYMSPSHTGVNVYGRGHVVAFNRIRRFSDSLAVANFGRPREDVNLQPVAIDFYNNEVSYAQDDCIETDYGAHNIRVYRNRCYNAHTGLSVQPSYGGPVYLIRNELYGITALTFKIHNYSAGILAYHNTVASASAGFQSFNRWQNGHFRNNLILGGSNAERPDGSVRVAYAMNTGTISGYSTLDYNGYRRNVPGPLIRWFDGKEIALYESLSEFAERTGHEVHGRMVDYDVFENAGPPKLGTTYGPEEYDLRLKGGSAAVDAGVRLPNVNDGFTGAAPDLGCYERGQERPHYGPREGS